MSNRHKVFVSYHHKNDQKYRDRFEKLFSEKYDIIESRSVEDGDINPNIHTDTVRRIIRDDYLQDSTVTVVLIGAETWKRKHVDWEISASISQTRSSDRSGLLGIFLPTHPDYGKEKCAPCIMPQRLYRNVKCKYAALYDWSTDPNKVQAWIHDAFKRRKRVNLNPHNSDPLFAKNRSGNGWC